MKDPREMTNERLFHWGRKTQITLSKIYTQSYSEYEKWCVVDRYELLKGEMWSRGIWNEFCEMTNSDPSHDAYDCMC